MTNETERPIEDETRERDELRQALRSLAGLRPPPFHSWKELLSMLIALGYRPRSNPQ